MKKTKVGSILFWATVLVWGSTVSGCATAEEASKAQAPTRTSPAEAQARAQIPWNRDLETPAAD